MTGGSLNPIAALRGQTITQSSSPHHRAIDDGCSSFKWPIESKHYELF
jgi:hypothetical protein